MMEVWMKMKSYFNRLGQVKVDKMMKRKKVMRLKDHRTKAT